MAQDAVDISRTYGAILLGAAAAFGLSGVVATQCIVYFKLYPSDRLHTKVMVVAVWCLDGLHSSFIFVSLFNYFITYWGNNSRIEYIPWSIAFSVIVTAIQTFLVHCFFAQKILKSSKNNWYITGPILFLAAARLLAATVSTIEMIRLHSFSAFILKYPGWVFTTGLSLSAGVDIIITAWLCYFLRSFRSRIGSDSTLMIRVVDTLTLYTLENGALTCIATTTSLLCWLIMPRNLIFLGLHFIIGKLYANSLKASLNTRNELRQLPTKRPSHAWIENIPTPTMQMFPRVQYPPADILPSIEEESPEYGSPEGESFEKAYIDCRLPRESTIIQWRAAPRGLAW